MRVDPHLRQACVPMPVADCPSRLPTKWIEALEQNQQISSCCRHPENHTIGAFYSSEDDEKKGVPDVYIFECTCGKIHRRFMLGGGKRPFWEVR